jgi:hypothetical protein
MRESESVVTAKHDGQFRSDAHSIEQARILATSIRVADELRRDPERVLDHARANIQRWGWLSRTPAERPKYEQVWIDLLEGPVEAILTVLEAPLTDERATHLRSTKPFAGVIHYAERWRVREHFRELLAERGYAHP